MFDHDVLRNARKNAYKGLAKEIAKKLFEYFLIALFITIFIYFGLLIILFLLWLFFSDYHTWDWDWKILFGFIDYYLVFPPLFLVLYLTTQGGASLRSILVFIKSAQDAKKIEELIVSQKDYVLYLYDFQSGEERFMVHIHAQNFHSTFGNHRKAKIIEQIHKTIPVVYFFNRQETNQNYGGLCFLIDNEHWFEYFKILYNHAKYVIVDYHNSAKSPNVIMEIEYIIGTPDKKLVFVGNAQFQSRLLEPYPAFREKIIANFELFPETTSPTVLPNEHLIYDFKIIPVDPVFEKIRKREL